MANKVILVTGASSDIGMALVRALLSESETLTVLAHSFSGGARIEALQSEFGQRVVSLTADFGDPDAVVRMADEITARYGTPGRVVHLPALRPVNERFTKVKWSQLERNLAVQVESIFLLLQKFLPNMAKMPDARVVFVLSSYTHGMPPKFVSLYTVVKYAQLGLMRAVAAEYASTMVRVNAISPSMVETQFLGELAPLVVRMSAGANPAGRNAQPEDLVGALLFLLSPGAEYITGVDLAVAAGLVC